MKRILVAVDGSPREPGVVQAAVEFANHLDARLTFLRVATIPVELPAQAFSMRPDEVEALIVKSARQALTQCVAGVPPVLVENTRVVVGAPWQAICDTARAENADLIMIGSHGYGGMDRLLGTTAAKVVNHADRSVLVVRC